MLPPTHIPPDRQASCVVTGTMDKRNRNLGICLRRDHWEKLKDNKKEKTTQTDNRKNELLTPIATANGKHSLICNQTELQGVHFLFSIHHSQLSTKFAKQAKR